MIGPTCPKCQAIHGGTQALGVFRPDGPIGYRARMSEAPIRATREEADADWCAWWQARPPSRDALRS